LDLVAHENDRVREASAVLAREKPQVTLDALRRLTPDAARHLRLPRRHELLPELDVESLLGIGGGGPKTLRALALASELVHGTAATLRDPARFAFAHGGKDGIPFPVDKLTYDKTIEILNRAINRAAVDRSEKVAAFRRLASLASSR